MKATESGTFKAVPLPAEGTYVARCYSVIHIGTVPNIYEGKLNGEVEKINVTWELPTAKAIFNDEKGPEPFVIGLELTLSTSDNSNLAKLVSQWRGKPFSAEEQKGFDPSVMVGKTCLISFVHKRKQKFIGKQIEVVTNQNTNMKFNAIMSRPKEMECPPPLNPPYIWDWEKITSGQEKFDIEKFRKMPKWLMEKCMTSTEFKKYAAHLMPKEEENTSTSSSIPAPTVEGEW